MLARRIIPCLDVNQGRVVKGVNFRSLRDAGDPVEQARVYEAEGADELVFLDITATHESRNTAAELARRVADEVLIPVYDRRRHPHAGRCAGAHPRWSRQDQYQLGGRSQSGIDQLTAAQLGSQAVVVAIDAKRISVEPLRWQVYVNGGRVPTGLDAVAWARQAAQRGAGEILLTSMDADGTQAGYDLELTRTIADAVGIPVIASGGAGRLEHFAQALTEGHASAALAASLFHYRQLSIPHVKRYLQEQGIPVRPFTGDKGWRK